MMPADPAVNPFMFTVHDPRFGYRLILVQPLPTRPRMILFRASSSVPISSPADSYAEMISRAVMPNVPGPQITMSM